MRGVRLCTAAPRPASSALARSAQPLLLASSSLLIPHDPAVSPLSSDLRIMLAPCVSTILLPPRQRLPAEFVAPFHFLWSVTFRRPRAVDLMAGGCPVAAPWPASSSPVRSAQSLWWLPPCCQFLVSRRCCRSTSLLVPRERGRRGTSTRGVGPFAAPEPWTLRRNSSSCPLRASFC